MTSTTIIRELARTSASPAVSIVCPFDTDRPGNTHDTLELEALRKEAVRRVKAEHGGEVSERVDAEIAAAFDEIDLGRPPTGVAVFVDPSHHRLVPLTRVHDPRVAVASRFSLGEVLESRADDVRQLVLVVTREQARCFVGNGRRLEEVADDGFPIVERTTVDNTPHADFPVGEHVEQEPFRHTMRDAMHAVYATARRTGIHDVVLVGTQRDLAYFDELDAPDLHVVGRVIGNHIEATVTELASLVHPVAASHARAMDRARCSDAIDAIGTHATNDAPAALAAASQGRGRSLVVEESAALPSGDDGQPQLVDELIDEVLAHDGDVSIVERGALGAAGPLVLLLRY